MSVIFSFGYGAVNTVFVEVEPYLDLGGVSVTADSTSYDSSSLKYVYITTTTGLVRNFLPKN